MNRTPYHILLGGTLVLSSLLCARSFQTGFESDQLHALLSRLAGGENSTVAATLDDSTLRKSRCKGKPFSEDEVSSIFKKIQDEYESGNGGFGGPGGGPGGDDGFGGGKGGLTPEYDTIMDQITPPTGKGDFLISFFNELCHKVGRCKPSPSLLHPGTPDKPENDEPEDELISPEDGGGGGGGTPPQSPGEAIGNHIKFIRGADFLQFVNGFFKGAWDAGVHYKHPNSHGSGSGNKFYDLGYAIGLAIYLHPRPDSSSPTVLSKDETVKKFGLQWKTIISGKKEYMDKLAELVFNLVERVNKHASKNDPLYPKNGTTLPVFEEKLWKEYEAQEIFIMIATAGGEPSTYGGKPSVPISFGKRLARVVWSVSKAQDMKHTKHQRRRASVYDYAAGLLHGSADSHRDRSTGRRYDADFADTNKNLYREGYELGSRFRQFATNKGGKNGEETLDRETHIYHTNPAKETHIHRKQTRIHLLPDADMEFTTPTTPDDGPIKTTKCDAGCLWNSKSLCFRQSEPLGKYCGALLIDSCTGTMPMTLKGYATQLSTADEKEKCMLLIKDDNFLGVELWSLARKLYFQKMTREYGHKTTTLFIDGVNAECTLQVREECGPKVMA